MRLLCDIPSPPPISLCGFQESKRDRNISSWASQRERLPLLPRKISEAVSKCSLSSLPSLSFQNGVQPMLVVCARYEHGGNAMHFSAFIKNMTGFHFKMILIVATSFVHRSP